MFSDFRKRIDRYRGGPGLSRSERTVLSLRAPAFRHGIDPRARRVRALSFAASRRRRRGDLALGSSSGGSSTRRSSGTIRMWSRGRSGPSTTRSRSLTIRPCFTAWCEGRTGYPIVDAAMRQLNAFRLHAQPAADDRRQLPRQGPAGRLALGRALLRANAARLRPRLQQRRLAVGSVHRLRRTALLQDLQSRDAIATLRSRGKVHSALRTGARGIG
jgi:hypothetical protein